VAHPSYTRLTALTAEGAGITAAGLALGAWWWRRERRRRSRHTALIWAGTAYPGAAGPAAAG
jgi:hypothetical protein